MSIFSTAFSRNFKEQSVSEECDLSSRSGLRSAGDASTSSSSLPSMRCPYLELPFLTTPILKSKLRYRGQRVVCMAQKKERRVGNFRREGNVSLASFGIKLKRNRQGQAIDITKSLSKVLPFDVAVTAVAALTRPSSFAWVSKKYYAPALGGIMLSIGIQLSVSDFALVVKRPVPVMLGYAVQYMMKPLLGFMTVKLFNVPTTFAAGLVLTSCVAGAQLSSYASFLSKGDVALSIVLASLTTITSIAVIPLLTRMVIGSVVAVDVFAMTSSMLQVVIGPVLLGLALNTYANPLVDRERNLMPLIAMVCTSLCIGGPLALNRDMIVSTKGLQLMLPILAFDIGAFAGGYWICQVPLWRNDVNQGIVEVLDGDVEGPSSEASADKSGQQLQDQFNRFAAAVALADKKMAEEIITEMGVGDSAGVDPMDCSDSEGESRNAMNGFEDSERFIDDELYHLQNSTVAGRNSAEEIPGEIGKFHRDPDANQLQEDPSSWRSFMKKWEG